MNSLDDRKKVDESTAIVEQPSSEQVKVENADQDVPVQDSDIPTLYNDVVMNVSEVDDAELSQDSEMPAFTANQLHTPFSADGDFSEFPELKADKKITDERQEPVLRDHDALEAPESRFVAVDKDSDAENDAVNEEEEAVVVPPKKQRKGSALGMGWFQGFNLFICGLIFVGLALFAYFIFGEKPLYSGKLPKYVVIENEELGATAALNPAIPMEERKSYIYVPKVKREDTSALEKPHLDNQNIAGTTTKIEMYSGNEEAEIIETTDSSEAVEPAFELFSIDHNADGVSAEELALVDGFILQAEIAFMQGNYVGVDEMDAYFYYQQVLALDSKNRTALQGLTSIADVYYRSAYDAFNYGDLDVAQQYLAIGLVVQPNHRSLLDLQQRLEQGAFVPQNNNNDFGGFEWN
ncbi:tetratricopeptide repeat protein [Ignatzschineria sp. LJL83]